MSNTLNEREKSRTFVLMLKEKNPTCEAPQTANELQSFENPHTLSRESLLRIINLILNNISFWYVL